MNSSGLFWNIANFAGLNFFNISKTVLRVNVTPLAISPTRSYLTVDVDTAPTRFEVAVAPPLLYPSVYKATHY